MTRDSGQGDAESQQFAQVPRWWYALLEGRAIGKRQFIVGTTILLYYNPRERDKCYPSIAKLAEITGIAGRHVREDIARLEAVGALEVVRVNGRSNRYRLPTKRAPKWCGV